MKYVTLCGLRTGKGPRDRIPAGTEIELSDAAAAPLLNRESPAIAAVARPAVLVAPAPKATAMTAKAAVHLVAAATTLGQLATIRAAELAREDGVRKTVVDALDAKEIELSAESEGGSAAGEGDEG